MTKKSYSINISHHSWTDSTPLFELHNYYYYQDSIYFARCCYFLNCRLFLFVVLFDWQSNKINIPAILYRLLFIRPTLTLYEQLRGLLLCTQTRMLNSVEEYLCSPLSHWSRRLLLWNCRYYIYISSVTSIGIIFFINVSEAFMVYAPMLPYPRVGWVGLGSVRL